VVVLVRWLLAGLLPGLALVVSACPVDAGARTADTLLTLQGVGSQVMVLGPREASLIKQTSVTQRLSLSAPAGAAASERVTTFAGWLVRDLLLSAGFGGGADRSARWTVVEAVATDGYRAYFSWGELFNSEQGGRVLVVKDVDGQPLGAEAGPLALRSLGDTRPGPRHVRNLCALVIRRLN